MTDDLERSARVLRRQAWSNRAVATVAGTACIVYTMLAFNQYPIFWGTSALFQLGIAYLALRNANTQLDRADAITERNQHLRRLRGDE